MDDNTTPMDEPDEELARRLAAFASAPLDPTVAARCTSRLRDGMRTRRRATRAAVLVAALVGTMLLSGVGLAAADTLPDPVQEVAHTTLAKVGVHVPPGHERYNDPVVCPGGPYKNHGAYVRAHKDDPDGRIIALREAGQVDEPTPTRPGSDDEPDSAAPDDGNEGTGPPPWAHGHSADHAKGEKKAKDESDDDDGDDAQDGTDEPGRRQGPRRVRPADTRYRRTGGRSYDDRSVAVDDRSTGHDDHDGRGAESERPTRAHRREPSDRPA